MPCSRARSWSKPAASASSRRPASWHRPTIPASACRRAGRPPVRLVVVLPHPEGGRQFGLGVPHGRGEGRHRLRSRARALAQSRVPRGWCGHSRRPRPAARGPARRVRRAARPASGAGGAAGRRTGPGPATAADVAVSRRAQPAAATATSGSTRSAVEVLVLRRGGRGRSTVPAGPATATGPSVADRHPGQHQPHDPDRPPSTACATRTDMCEVRAPRPAPDQGGRHICERMSRNAPARPGCGRGGAVRGVRRREGTSGTGQREARERKSGAEAMDPPPAAAGEPRGAGPADARPTPGHTPRSYRSRLLIFEPSHTSGSYLRSTARSLSGISALSVILMPSGQTSVQHLVMLQ